MYIYTYTYTYTYIHIYMYMEIYMRRGQNSQELPVPPTDESPPAVMPDRVNPSVALATLGGFGHDAYIYVYICMYI